MQANVSLHATVIGALSSVPQHCPARPLLRSPLTLRRPPPLQPASPLTANVTLASQYRYRGLMQTNNKPAIQGGVDYALPNGFYVGNGTRRSVSGRFQPQRLRPHRDGFLRRLQGPS